MFEQAGISHYKVAYVGPALAGKTTNLQVLWDRCDPAARGRLLSLATETDRLLFFDFQPPAWGGSDPARVRIHLYTAPGPIFYPRSRQLLLKGADAIVFVADSVEERLDANIKLLTELEANLALSGIALADMPFVIQYNKRDHPLTSPEARAARARDSWSAAHVVQPVEVLAAALNPAGRPSIEAIAFRGIGVKETLDAVLAQIRERPAAVNPFHVDPPQQPSDVAPMDPARARELILGSQPRRSRHSCLWALVAILLATALAFVAASR